MSSPYILPTKEFAYLLLKTLLKKLPPTKSGRGMYISDVKIPEIKRNVVHDFTYWFYPSYRLLRGENAVSQSKFYDVAALVLGDQFNSLPVAGWLGHRISDDDALNQLVTTIVDTLDQHGLLEEIDKKLKMDNIIKILDRLEENSSIVPFPTVFINT